MARKIIIDTDPGQDDAVALLLALASPEDFDVLGVVAVAGNVELERTALNARKILELAGRADIPCFAGCDRPLQRPLVTAKHVHGATGLDGIVLPEPSADLAAAHGVAFIVETLRREPAGAVTLCTLGPLTDIAAALRQAPDIAPRIGGIVAMGGACFEGGNITPAAEFNIYVDPEAAEIVMASGAPITLLPLDATHKVLSTRPRLDRIGALGNRAGKAVASLLSFSERFDLEKYNWQGAPLHDPCVIAWLVRPDLFAARRINVAIETGSELTRGMTVTDFWRVSKRAANVDFVHGADAEGFYGLLTERLARLP